MVSAKQIVLRNVPEPKLTLPAEEPQLSDKVYQQRLQKTLQAMKENGLDYLVIYADREHYSNFDYLTGFGPRFEEGILLLRHDGQAAVLLGNECYGMYEYSRLPVKGILYQVLSLPNQPLDESGTLEEIVREFGLSLGQKVGMVGWKLLYPYYGGTDMFDVPAFILDSIKSVVGTDLVVNATHLFIHPEYGIRMLYTAEEIAYFEFGAAYASDAVQNMMNGLRTGITELELSREMRSGGLPISCFPMLSTGFRTKLGLVSPATKVIELGDSLSCSQGLRGGLTCRAGFVAYSADDLEEGARDYIDKLAAPYFATVVNWFEHVKIGAAGGDIYNMVQSQFPKETYGWVLNPGHFIATEEWSASAIYPGSDIRFKSGMCIQMDLIPSIGQPYAGANCEDGIVLADQELRSEIERDYPEMFERMMSRRQFMIDHIGIRLPKEVLPMSNITGLYRPYMLNKNLALAVKS